MKKVTVTCPHCEADVLAWYSPGEKGSTYGPPEQCFEAHGSCLETAEPECEQCGEEFDDDDVDKMLANHEEWVQTYEEHFDEERWND